MLIDHASISVRPTRFREVRLRPRMRSCVSTDDLAGIRCALEIGLYFVLCEGLMRRLVPTDTGTILMAVKFVYFPLLYLFFVLLPKSAKYATHAPRHLVVSWLGRPDFAAPRAGSSFNDGIRNSRQSHVRPDRNARWRRLPKAAGRGEGMCAWQHLERC